MAQQQRRQRNVAHFESALAECRRYDAPRFWVPPSPPDTAERASPCVVEVRGENCFRTVLDLVAHGRRPLLLNMASEHSPGGGVRTGASAMEEVLCRVSTLYPTLAEEGRRRRLYPLRSPFVIDGVTLFRDEDEEDLPRSAAVRFAVLCSAAVKRQRAQWDEPEMRRRIGAMLDLAAAYATSGAADVLVLSAYGCGAYGNPADGVAALFRQAIDARRLRLPSLVVFSILADPRNEARVGDNRRAFEAALLR